MASSQYGPPVGAVTPQSSLTLNNHLLTKNTLINLPPVVSDTTLGDQNPNNISRMSSHGASQFLSKPSRFNQKLQTRNRQLSLMAGDEMMKDKLFAGMIMKNAKSKSYKLSANGRKRKHRHTKDPSSSSNMLQVTPVGNLNEMSRLSGYGDGEDRCFSDSEAS